MSYGPPPPAYGAPGQPYGAAAGTNKKAIWSLVTGILGVVCCSPAAIAAIFLARSARTEMAQTGEQGSGMATAGFVLGIIGLVFLVLGIILLATGTLTFDGTFDTSST